jgi:molybdate transport system substrate-binding protein
MKRRSWVLLAVAATVMMVLGAGAGPASAATQPKFTVFAAASLYKAFPSMVAPFKAKYPQYKNVKFVFNFAGSNQLVEEIQGGAYADIFAAASTGSSGSDALLSPTVYINTPRLFCQNALCVIVPNVKGHKVTSLADLATTGTQIAIGTSSVPIGQYTQKVLTNLDLDSALGSNFATEVNNNVLAYGAAVANVNMVTALVVLNEVDAGFVYNSDKVAAGSKVIRIPIADAYQTDPLPTYPIATVKGSTKLAMGKRFISFVLGAKGQKILKAWGFRARPVPIVSSLSATSGAAGTSVTITGTNFGSNKTGYVQGVVKFGTTVATTTAWSTTSITATVPSIAAGAYKLTVTADGQVSKTTSFTVTP